MNFREAVQSDFDYLADHSISRGIQKRLPEQVDYVYVLEHEGAVLCLGGFQMANLTTAWCWIDISSEVGDHIVMMYRVIRDWIEKFCKDHKIRRLQAYVECDFSEAITLVQHLGFHKESIMKKFMGDNDAFMYAKVI